MKNYDVTIAITTKNRKEDLCKAVSSALAQTAHVEVLIVDDGSDDGTCERIRSEFPPEKYPQIKLDRQNKPLGLIAERSRMADLASAPIIVSIDDDVIFASEHTIAQTLETFTHPRIGAVTIPLIDVYVSKAVIHRAPEQGVIYVTEQFRGGAHAIRKDLFVQLGRYRNQLVRQGEERDFCIRMLNAGFVVALGSADPVYHYEHSTRSRPLIITFTSRNTLWYAWHNVPMPSLVGYLAGATALLLADGVKHPSRFWPRIKGVTLGYAGFPREWKHRRPVSRRAYQLNRKLKKNRAVPLSAIEADLPPIACQARSSQIQEQENARTVQI